MSKRKENITLKNDHKFKKKKLNNMLNNTKHQECITQLETLLSKKNNWGQNELKTIFEFLYNNFEATSVYGYKLEKVFLEIIDNTESPLTIQLTSMCMSRFVSFKRSNNSTLIQIMMHSFINLGIQFFDYFKAPTNLNDIQLSSPTCPNVFSELIIKSESDVWTVVNRIDFAMSTIRYAFDSDNILHISVPFRDLIKLSLALLSEAPGNLNCPMIHGISETIFIIHTSVIKLLMRMTAVFEFRSCFFGYVQVFVEIAIGAITDNLTISDFTNDYLYSLMSLMHQISLSDGASCLSKMTPIVSPLINYVLRSSNDIISTISLNLLCEVLKNVLDIRVCKCVKLCSSQIKQLIIFTGRNNFSHSDAYNVAADRLAKVISKYELHKEEICDDFLFNEVMVSDDLIIDNGDECAFIEDITETNNTQKLDTVNDSVIEMEIIAEPSLKEFVISYEAMATEDDVDIQREDLSEKTQEVFVSEKSLSVEEMLKCFVPF